MEGGSKENIIRRKTLKNCLLGAGFDREKIVSAIQKMNLDENVRGEKYSLRIIFHKQNFLFTYAP